MMLSIIKVSVCLIIIFSIIGCSIVMKKNNQQFTWGAQKGGPKAYPMEMIRGTLYFKGEDRGLPIPTGTSYGKWGQGMANHPHVTQSLPDRLKVTFYSYAENQAYQGTFDLPYDKLLELFQWGVENPKIMGDSSFPIFTKFVVGITPGGTVAVWIIGHGEQREVLFGQAEKIDMSLSSVFQVPFRSDQEAETFRIEVLEESVGEVQFKNIQQNGAPFDIWQRYRKPYHWVIQAEKNAPIRNLYVSHINGEFFSAKTDYSQENNSSIPSFIRFRFGAELYDLNLDDYETIAAFEQLEAIEGLKPEERLIHIEVSPVLPRENSSIRLYNAKQSIVLKKTKFKPSR
jgi:hypothetical protein